MLAERMVVVVVHSELVECWFMAEVMVHCKIRLAVFPSPAGMSLTTPSLVGNNLIFPGQGEFG